MTHSFLLRGYQAHLDAYHKTESLLGPLSALIDDAVKCLSGGGRIFLCGNGGSAADAQHIAAELSGRYVKERPGLAGIALTTDTSVLTAVGNDYGFERIFARQVEALGRPGDLLIGISTSGNSANVLAAFETAERMGVKTWGFSGRDGGRMTTMIGAQNIVVPIQETARVQEMHILLGHLLCEGIDELL